MNPSSRMSVSCARMNLNVSRSTGRGAAAFSLPEAIMAVCVLGVMLVSLYAGSSSGFSIVQSSREELRATQILVQQMESLRLYNWDQVQNTNYLVPTFMESYNPLGETGQGGGVVYGGSITTR